MDALTIPAAKRHSLARKFIMRGLDSVARTPEAVHTLLKQGIAPSKLSPKSM